MRRLFVALVVALATLVVSVSCGGGTPTTPSTPPASPPVVTPPAPGPTASLSSLSEAARAYVPKTMSASVIQRMADRNDADLVRVYPGPYSPSLIAQATGIWEKYTPLRFRVVTSEAEAEIVVANEIDAGLSEKGCGSASVHANLPVILGGRARIAIGLKPNCLDQGNTLVGGIAHEIGHILGFGHSPDFLDLMSPSSSTLDLAPPTAEVVRWIYSAPLGATVVQ